mgnify:CR=1 FL=1
MTRLATAALALVATLALAAPAVAQDRATLREQAKAFDAAGREYVRQLKRDRKAAIRRRGELAGFDCVESRVLPRDADADDFNELLGSGQEALSREHFLSFAAEEIRRDGHRPSGPPVAGRVRPQRK